MNKPPTVTPAELLAAMRRLAEILKELRDVIKANV